MPRASLTSSRARRGALPSLVLALLPLALALTVTGGFEGCATAPRPSPSSESSDEAKLMEGLRRQVKASPADALADAEQAEAHFGESPFAEERRALAIQALVGLDRIGEARSRAYQFVDRYPSGPFTAQVQALTGVHPSPPVGPAK